MLSDEQRELRATFRRFAEREILPGAAEADERAEYPWKSFEAYRDSGFVLQDVTVEAHMRGFALVVEFLAQPVGDLGMDLGGRNRPVVALVDPHRELELAQIGLDRRSHLRILQFAGERGAVERDGPVYLTQ